ncbi:hypothetical protein B0I35DRAFT_439555 [Stachybotrys elegans]|uniref:BZIP domain-containing protein n=1 Tax=Stachybotrys elegans TaxID=80388 RepID=A0A8K0WN39_9HYPO|nr:hypothetical protein B0I35DRAFT_439555 [Stachybotrys elegans]
MPSRPQEITDKAVLQRQRERAREAQRRFRLRRLNALAEADARNKKLEEAIDTLFDAFTKFSKQVSPLIDGHADGATMMSLQDTLKTFVTVAKGLETEPAEETLLETREEERPEEPRREDTPPFALPGTELYQADEARARNDHQSYDEMMQMGSRTSRALENAPASPFIQLMLHHNPVLSEDYWGIDLDLTARAASPLWQRLFHTTMVVSYRHLRLAQKDNHPRSQWFQRAHQFSLHRANPLSLLNLTAIGLRIAAMEIQDATDPKDEGSRSPARYFDIPEYHMLGTIIKQDMVAQGVPLDDIVGAEDVEASLREKGMTGYDDEHIYLTLDANNQWCKNLLPTASGNIMVTIGIRSFIRHMIDASVCLGDAIGYHRPAMNLAIVRSAAKLDNLT